MQELLRTIRRLAGGDPSKLSTDELLERFFVQRDEDAFTALIGRYGPMVYGVCLRILGRHQDAEDAFQATFLMLVRKGQAIRRRAALSSWLYRVAYRVSITQRARGGPRMAQVTSDSAIDTGNDDPASRELGAALDEEVQRLPSRYRSVIVLCGLQGKSYEEASRELGCPRATVAVRLLRARLLLKTRLAKRGLIAAATALTIGATVPQALAAVPDELAAATAAAATAIASGVGLAAVVSVGVIALIKTATRDVSLEKCKVLLVLVLASLGVSGAGAGAGAQLGLIDRTMEPAGPAFRSEAAAPSPAAGRKPAGEADAAIKLDGPGARLRFNPAIRTSVAPPPIRPTLTLPRTPEPSVVIRLVGGRVIVDGA